MRSMISIRKLKKQARMRAAASGTSHQSELNAIAREMGYASWGGLVRATANKKSPDKADKPYPSPRVAPAHMLIAMTPEEQANDAELERQRYDMLPLEDAAGELRDLIDAYQAARRAGGHLVVLRPTPAREEKVIELLWIHQDENPRDARLTGMAFTPSLDDGGVAIQDANSHGHTLVVGSGRMSRDSNHGQFVVHDERQGLSQINALYSKRDQEIVYATTAVNYVLPRNDQDTVKPIRGMVGPTIIKRRNPAKGCRQPTGRETS